MKQFKQPMNNNNNNNHTNKSESTSNNSTNSTFSTINYPNLNLQKNKLLLLEDDLNQPLIPPLATTLKSNGFNRKTIENNSKIDIEWTFKQVSKTA